MTRAKTPRRNAAATRQGLATPHAGNEIHVASVEPLYFTRAEVAARIRRSVKTLTNWAAMKPRKGPYCKRIEGGKVVYPRREYLEWEKAQLAE